MRLLTVLALIGLIWLLGLLGVWWLACTWLALALYGIGTLVLLVWQLAMFGVVELFLWSDRWRRSLLLGLAAAGLLAVLALMGMHGVAPGGMEPTAADLAITQLNALPAPALWAGLALLILVEELLWRGLLLSALQRAGQAPWLAVLLTTAGFSLNHLAVAPIPWMGRWMLAAMALPMGLASGVITLVSGCLWGGVLLHGLLMALMAGGMGLQP